MLRDRNTQADTNMKVCLRVPPSHIFLLSEIVDKRELISKNKNTDHAFHKQHIFQLFFDRVVLYYRDVINRRSP